MVCLRDYCTTMNSVDEKVTVLMAKGKSIFLSKDNPMILHATASLFGSIATILTLNPLFVVKVRVQNMDGPSPSYHSIVQVFKDVKNERGMIGFWSGSSTALAMSVPNTIVYMTAYEKCKEVLSKKFESTLLPGVAGAIARMISVTAVSPFELIRTIQSSGRNERFFQIAKDIVQRNGFLGLYRGWTSTIWRDCPFSAIYWYSFERLRPRFNSAMQLTHTEKFSAVATMMSGSTAGALAAVVTHPFDVIKTQLQLDKSTIPRHNFMYYIRSKSFGFFFRGLSLRLLTVIPACGIVITIFDGLKSVS